MARVHLSGHRDRKLQRPDRYVSVSCPLLERDERLIIAAPPRPVQAVRLHTTWYTATLSPRTRLDASSSRRPAKDILQSSTHWATIRWSALTRIPPHHGEWPMFQNILNRMHQFPRNTQSIMIGVANRLSPNSSQRLQPTLQRAIVQLLWLGATMALLR